MEKKDYPNISNTSKALIKWWFFKEHENFKYYFAQRSPLKPLYIYTKLSVLEIRMNYTKNLTHSLN